MHWIKPHTRDYDEGLSFIIKGCLEFKKALLKSSPITPFPQNACCFTFKVSGTDLTNLPLPLELIFHFWATSPNWRGRCFKCGEASVFGIGCGGMLAYGGVMGHCVNCHERNFLRIGGIARVGDMLRKDLTGSRFNGDKMGYGGCYKGGKEELYERLVSLGYKNIPGKEWLEKHMPSVASISVNTGSNE